MGIFFSLIWKPIVLPLFIFFCSSYLNDNSFLSQIKFPCLCVSFWAFSSFSLFVSLLYINTALFNYYFFTLRSLLPCASLEVFWFLFFFAFPNNFQNQYVKFHKKLCRDFDWNNFAYMGQSRQTYLYNTESINSWIWYYYSFIWLLYVFQNLLYFSTWKWQILLGLL